MAVPVDRRSCARWAHVSSESARGVVIYRLVTLGEGSRKWQNAAKRIVREAKQFDAISTGEIETFGRLTEDQRFADIYNSEWFSRAHRGAGFWIWKPYVIASALSRLTPQERGVIYIDAGCTLNASRAAQQKLTSYIELSEENGSLSFALEGQPERLWTKVDLLDHFGLLDEGRSSNQIAATVSFWSRSDAANQSFLSHWKDTNLLWDHHFIDDSPSTKQEDVLFREHRHDQSTFSVLTKAHKRLTIPDPTWHHPNWLEAGAEEPIWATRNTSAYSVGDTSLRASIGRQLEKILWR